MKINKTSELLTTNGKLKLAICLALLALAGIACSDDEVSKIPRDTDRISPVECKTVGFQTVCNNK